MTVLVSGSIARDAVFFHEGAFARQLEAGDVRHVNTTFLAPRMRRDYGGCAANISAAMRRLGGDPLPWGVVGEDDADYLRRFDSLGIRTEGVARIAGERTAECVILTDSEGAQISAFHPGALAHGAEAPWPRIKGRDAAPALAILSPAGQEATLRAARECVSRGVPFLFDVGQELPLFTREELLALLDASFGIACSDFECEAFARTTGLRPVDIARMGRLVLHTHGARGASLWEPKASESLHVEAIPVRARNAIGAGDAMRGGFLAGLERGLAPLESARLGAVAAARKVAGESAQDYALTLDAAREDYARMWGDAPF